MKVTLWKHEKPLRYLCTLQGVEGPYEEYHVVLDQTGMQTLLNTLKEDFSKEEDDGNDTEKGREVLHQIG